jgi:hypothetical protein
MSRNLLERLISARVDFVVIGGFAGYAHGASSLTQELGICCDYAIENLMRLGPALDDIHPVDRLDPRRPPVRFTPETFQGLDNLFLSTGDGEVDCLSSVLGVGDFAEVKRNSIEVPFAGGICRVLSLDALIRSKEALDRPRDREVVRELIAIRDARPRG